MLFRVNSWIVFTVGVEQTIHEFTRTHANADSDTVDGSNRKVTYSATFKDHLAHPRNVGELSPADASAEETNPMCGDRLRLSLSVRSERIEEVKFLAYGCPPTIVCGSVLTELLHGQEIAKALELTKADLLNAVGGLPSRKHHAATLAIETLHAALKGIDDF